MAAELNMIQVGITAAITAITTGVITGFTQYFSFKGTFGEFKVDIERRVQIVEDESKNFVSIRECEKSHVRNDKEHDEIFGRLRSTESGIIAVKRNGG